MKFKVGDKLVWKDGNTPYIIIEITQVTKDDYEIKLLKHSVLDRMNNRGYKGLFPEKLPIWFVEEEYKLLSKLEKAM